MSLLLLAAAIPAVAQHAEPAQQAMIKPSAFKSEIKQMERLLLEPGSSGSKPFEMVEGTEITTAKELLPGQDYFPAELFLNHEIKSVANPAMPHEYATKTYNNVNVRIGDEVLNDMTCYVISDQYKLKGKETVNGAFEYHNTYFLYKDHNGNVAYTISYIENTVDFLRTEYRIVQKGSMANAINTLLIAPNPADKHVTLSYSVVKSAHYALYIKDMSGKTVHTVFANNLLEAGSHVSGIQVELASGTYLVNLTSNDGVSVSQKLIIR